MNVVDAWEAQRVDDDDYVNVNQNRVHERGNAKQSRTLCVAVILLKRLCYFAFLQHLHKSCIK